MNSKQLVRLLGLLFVGATLLVFGLYVVGTMFFLGLSWVDVFRSPARRLTTYPLAFWLHNAVFVMATLCYVWLLRAMVNYVRGGRL